MRRFTFLRSARTALRAAQHHDAPDRPVLVLRSLPSVIGSAAASAQLEALRASGPGVADATVARALEGVLAERRSVGIARRRPLQVPDPLLERERGVLDDAADLPRVICRSHFDQVKLLPSLVALLSPSRGVGDQHGIARALRLEVRQRLRARQ